MKHVLIFALALCATFGAVARDLNIAFAVTPFIKTGYPTEIGSDIVAAIASANAAFIASGSDIRFIHTGDPIIGYYEEPVSMMAHEGIDYASLSDALHSSQLDYGLAQYRDRVGADVIVILDDFVGVSQAHGGMGDCGESLVIGALTGPSAVAAIDYVCFSDGVSNALQHEIGHLMGFQHDFSHDPKTLSTGFPQGHGYWSANFFGTYYGLNDSRNQCSYFFNIMSYYPPYLTVPVVGLVDSECGQVGTSAKYVNHWSDPALTYYGTGGAPGVAEGHAGSPDYASQVQYFSSTQINNMFSFHSTPMAPAIYAILHPPSGNPTVPSSILTFLRKFFPSIVPYLVQ